MLEGLKGMARLHTKTITELAAMEETYKNA